MLIQIYIKLIQTKDITDISVLLQQYLNAIEELLQEQSAIATDPIDPVLGEQMRTVFFHVDKLVETYEQHFEQRMNILKQKVSKTYESVNKLNRSTTEMLDWSLQFWRNPAACSLEPINVNLDSIIDFPELNLSVAPSEAKNTEVDATQFKTIPDFIEVYRDKLDYIKELFEATESLKQAEQRANDQDDTMNAVTSETISSIQTWGVWQEKTIGYLKAYHNKTPSQEPSDKAPEEEVSKTGCTIC